MRQWMSLHRKAKADEEIADHFLERAAVKRRKIQSRNSAYLFDKALNCTRKVLAKIKELSIS